MLDVLLSAADAGDVSSIGCGGCLELLFRGSAFLRFSPGFERCGFASVGGVDFPEGLESFAVCAERPLFGFCRLGGWLCLGQLEELSMSVIFPWFSSMVLFYC